MAGIGDYAGTGNYTMEKSEEVKPVAKYGMDRTPAMYSPYKMKGSPMHRNFGIGDAPGGVGDSPAKFWKKLKKAVGGIAKKVLDPLGLKKKADKALGIGGDAAGTEKAIAQHVAESHADETAGTEVAETEGAVGGGGMAGIASTVLGSGGVSGAVGGAVGGAAQVDPATVGPDGRPIQQPVV